MSVLLRIPFFFRTAPPSPIPIYTLTPFVNAMCPPTTNSLVILSTTFLTTWSTTSSTNLSFMTMIMSAVQAGKRGAHSESVTYQQRNHWTDSHGVLQISLCFRSPVIEWFTCYIFILSFVSCNGTMVLSVDEGINPKRGDGVAFVGV